MGTSSLIPLDSNSSGSNVLFWHSELFAEHVSNPDPNSFGVMLAAKLLESELVSGDSVALRKLAVVMVAGVV